MRAARDTSSAAPARHWLEEARLKADRGIPTPRDIADLVDNLARQNNVHVLYGEKRIEGETFHSPSSSLRPENAYVTLLALAECGVQGEPISVELQDARDLEDLSVDFFHPKVDISMLAEVARIRQICNELSKVGAEVVFNHAGRGTPLRTAWASRIREITTKNAAQLAGRPLSAVIEDWRKNTWTLEENMHGRFWLEDILGLKPGAVMY
ncbi:MAG: hypothetical protein WC645_06090 [Candidatus Margulisiibacteriota bacterium]